jgi:hypothetical protein
MNSCDARPDIVQICDWALDKVGEIPVLHTLSWEAVEGLSKMENSPRAHINSLKFLDFTVSLLVVSCVLLPNLFYIILTSNILSFWNGTPYLLKTPYL